MWVISRPVIDTPSIEGRGFECSVYLITVLIRLLPAAIWRSKISGRVKIQGKTFSWKLGKIENKTAPLEVWTVSWSTHEGFYLRNRHASILWVRQWMNACTFWPIKGNTIDSRIRDVQRAKHVNAIGCAALVAQTILGNAKMKKTWVEAQRTGRVYCDQTSLPPAE